MGFKGNKRKREVEKKGEESSFVSGSSEEASTDWWGSLSKIITGNPSSSQLLDKFKSTCSVSRKTFDYICSIVKEHMAKKHFTFTNGEPMLLNDQVALALIRLGSGNSLISIGDSFGAHHSTVSKVTWRFVEAIEEKGLCYIQWPSTEQEMTAIKRKFEKIHGLPNCCGAIDTTHITMQLSSSNPEADTWLDPKGNRSMILQAIVDPNLKFRNIITGWPGKMTDAAVLHSCSLCDLSQNGERLNGSKIHISEETELSEYIVGDSGFPLLTWLMTPYQHKELSETEAEFNKRVAATQGVAQRALAKLKEDWKMIQGDMWRPNRYKLPRFIYACCILHNIVIEMEDKVSDELPSSASHDPGYPQEVCHFRDKSALIMRDKLAMYLSGQ